MTCRDGTHRYRAEVMLQVGTGADVTWIRQSLDAACRRLRPTCPSLRILSAIHVPGDGRLSCVVTAARREHVQRLFEIALLPWARILEVQDLQACAPSPNPARRGPPPVTPRRRSRPAS